MMYMPVESRKNTFTPSVRRINARVFWTLLAIEGVVLALVFAWAVNALPSNTPAQAPANLPQIQQAIIDRLSGATNDPLIEVRPGLSVHESNVRGLSLGGTTYFYYVEGQPNFDPFSRGAVSANQIEQVLRDTSGPAPLVIYTIRQ